MADDGMQAFLNAVGHLVKKDGEMPAVRMRLLIALALDRGQRSAAEVAISIGLSPWQLSRHARVIRDKYLFISETTERVRGQSMHFELTPEGKKFMVELSRLLKSSR